MQSVHDTNAHPMKHGAWCVKRILFQAPDASRLTNDKRRLKSQKEIRNDRGSVHEHGCLAGCRGTNKDGRLFEMILLAIDLHSRHQQADHDRSDENPENPVQGQPP